ncbi:hypothetical protein [Joostella sp.]|uniref:hypothetical protein n=1 Tax=Joostella sp. TaxID=2231138 RepID=UPI003A912661
MIYNAKIQPEAEKAKERLNWLIEKEKTFELTVKNPKRSIPQNSYVHLLFSWFGLHFGYTLEEVKQEIYKKHVNAGLFYVEQVEGVVSIERWRSTADLNTAETTLAIDRFRDFSAQQGLYLPTPDDLVSLREIEREISKQTSKQYL